MLHWWWKIVGVVLLLGASVAALWVPLSPALVHVEPGRISPGPQEITVTGYNTQFAAEPVQVYLENGTDRICADQVEVVSPTLLKATFSIPEGLKENLT
ncbi:MAG TPA: hypothetical protein PK735_07005, partial [Flavobacteriales bacterium]|nr:hypothetical protein [Flavobacteriales bacterium]